jgi:SAM-dependent methyltransferase
LLPQINGPVLDLGFGQGYLEEFARQKGKRINMYGIDISKTVVDRAKKKFIGQFFVGDILNIQTLFNRKKFDVILAIEVIEHISPKDILTFLSDVSKSLNSHGIFLISTPLNEHLRKGNTNLSGHVRDYSIDILKMELEISGFKILEIHTFYAFKTFYTIKKCLSKIFKNKWEANNVVIKAQKVK